MLILASFFLVSPAFGEIPASGSADQIPRSLNSFENPFESAEKPPLLDLLAARIGEEPFNLAASIIFLLAIIHTFLAGFFTHWAHVVQDRHQQNLRKSGKVDEDQNVSALAQALHYLGEVEAIFGLWVLGLVGVILYYHDWTTAKIYLTSRVYVEPIFVVVIMALSSTRPILFLAENSLRKIANLGGGTVGAWWISILIFGPLLGSFITEPAAMTISALLLGKQVYRYEPSPKLLYGTIGLLFTNISVGGVLTNFAAPPVLMVAGPWQWSSLFMLTHFGWKATIGILCATLSYYFVFRRDLKLLERSRLAEAKDGIEVEFGSARSRIPWWIILVHVLFMIWTVIHSHDPVLFVGGFLFFLAFMQMTPQFQNRLEMRGPILVGFFLAGLVVHGGLQGWWIQPLLGGFDATALMIASTILTSFNDNAAITLLSTLVPNFSPELKYAVVAGAVTGGGLTFIANAPNPAGKAVLMRFFPGQIISPVGLALGALLPTIVMGLAFALL